MRERDPDRGSEHPVRPIAPILGNDERDERRDRDVVDRPRQGSGEQDDDEYPEPDAGDRREHLAGVVCRIARPIRNRTSVATDDPSIACFFLWWSTMEPNQIPVTAVSTRKIPAMTEVEMTDRVVRYAQ